MDRSFTVKSAGGLLNSLRTPCRVSQAFDPAHGVPEFKLFEIDAIWDTGAAKSVITKRVVEACGLKPIKSGYIQGVHGIQKTESYVINIYLPDKVTFFNLTVVRGSPPNGWWDVLIGMDIISAGNFSVKNVDSKTEWSFSIPSRPKT